LVRSRIPAISALLNKPSCPTPESFHVREGSSKSNSCLDHANLPALPFAYNHHRKSGKLQATASWSHKGHGTDRRMTPQAKTP